MKRTILLLCALLLTVAGLSGCGAANKNKSGIKVVATVFPIYDWTREIIGETADSDTLPSLTLLLGNGTDIHSYQPSVEDIVTISTCDVFIYVGGESEEWVADALKSAKNRDMIVVNLLEVLGDAAKEEETPEGATPSEEEESDEPEYDEHVWLSLKNATVFCDAIANALKTADEKNEERYDANTKAYTGKLNKLDSEYETAVNAAPVKSLVFGDRFPFRYLTDDYGIKYYAAFSGCSAETQASFETITFLAGKVNELSLKSIMIIDSSDGRFAKTIKDSTNTKDQTIRTLDSMQSVTYDDIKNNVTYLSVMESNLTVLKEALQ